MNLPAFPTSIPEFHRFFPDEHACFRYLTQSRWPKGFVCPHCGGSRAFSRRDRLALQCVSCKRFFTATAGTAMHGSRQPLSYWLLATWMLVTDKRGVSATLLSRDLGLRVETAWNMLHKLRAAMVAPDREPLRGTVEVDETLIGGTRHGIGKGTWKGAQEVVIGAMEVHGRHMPGRIRLWQMPAARGVLAVEFVRQSVEAASTVRTDGSHLYDNLAKSCFDHEIVSVAHGAKQEEVLPTLHLAFSNLKAWLQGTFHGAVRKEHLQAYLNEFAFRFNRRRNLHAAFQTVLGIAPMVEGPTYRGLYEGTFAHAEPHKRTRKP